MLSFVPTTADETIPFERPILEDIPPSKIDYNEDRKQLFRNIKEFRRYLQRLDEWLAITGRPR